jgi:hypothetical protein
MNTSYSFPYQDCMEAIAAAGESSETGNRRIFEKPFMIEALGETVYAEPLR